LPQTNYHLHPNNPVEKIFWGRIPVTHATAQYYFTKESMMQHLMHQFKYRGNRELGSYLGKLMGQALMQTNRFAQIDAIVPLPLHEVKERKRGYNQARVLCDGMAAVLNKPVCKDVIRRRVHTESQTKKNRIARWENMKDRFELIHSDAMEGRHVLLVDDVITTGATLEACGSVLMQIPDIRLSIAALCFSAGN
jgi:ComF family protein